MYAKLLLERYVGCAIWISRFMDDTIIHGKAITNLLQYGQNIGQIKIDMECYTGRCKIIHLSFKYGCFSEDYFSYWAMYFHCYRYYWVFYTISCFTRFVKLKVTLEKSAAKSHWEIIYIFSNNTKNYKYHTFMSLLEVLQYIYCLEEQSNSIKGFYCSMKFTRLKLSNITCKN